MLRHLLGTYLTLQFLQVIGQTTISTEWTQTIYTDKGYAVKELICDASGCYFILEGRGLMQIGDMILDDPIPDEDDDFVSCIAILHFDSSGVFTDRTLIKSQRPSGSNYARIFEAAKDLEGNLWLFIFTLGNIYLHEPPAFIEYGEVDQFQLLKLDPEGALLAHSAMPFDLFRPVLNSTIDGGMLLTFQNDAPGISVLGQIVPSGPTTLLLNTEMEVLQMIAADSFPTQLTGTHGTEFLQYHSSAVMDQEGAIIKSYLFRYPTVIDGTEYIPDVCQYYDYFDEDFDGEIDTVLITRTGYSTVIAKYEADGTLLWSHELKNCEDVYAGDITITPENNIFIQALASSNANTILNNSSILFPKTDAFFYASNILFSSEGDLIYAKRYLSDIDIPFSPVFYNNKMLNVGSAVIYHENSTYFDRVAAFTMMNMESDPEVQGYLFCDPEDSTDVGYTLRLLSGDQSYAYVADDMGTCLRLNDSIYNSPFDKSYVFISKLSSDIYEIIEPPVETPIPEDFLIFPNPAHNEASILVSAKDLVTSVKMFNSIGEEISLQAQVDEDGKLNLTFPSGLHGTYFIRLRLESSETRVVSVVIY
jgi:hypothetical protein